MILHKGETIWTMSAYYGKTDGTKVYVHRCTVLDGENNVIRQHWDGGHDFIRVLDTFSSSTTSVYPTEAEAWQGAAAVFAKGASELTAKADECLQQAAASVVGEAVPS